MLQASLLEAAPLGYKPLHPQGAEVNSLLGARVEGGPLDNAAFLQVLDPQGIPAPSITLPMEVKNIRHWIYPNSAELFQLLHKAALLQINHADLSFVPVLVSRRRSFYAWEMGQALGFFPIQVYAQFVLPRSEAPQEQVTELQDELGYRDLQRYDGAHPRLTSALTKALPSRALELAARWHKCGPPLSEHFAPLREYMAPSDRAVAMKTFRHDASEILGEPVAW